MVKLDFHTLEPDLPQWLNPQIRRAVYQTIAHWMGFLGTLQICVGALVVELPVPKYFASLC